MLKTKLNSIKRYRFLKPVLMPIMSLTPLFTFVACKQSKLKEELPTLATTDLKRFLATDIKAGSDFSSFYQDLLDSATNSYPKVFLTRNAGQVYNTSFALMSAILALGRHLKPLEKRKVIFLIDETVNNYRKTLNSEKQRFNFLPLLNKYGDGSKNEEGEIELYNNLSQIKSEAGQSLKSLAYQIRIGGHQDASIRATEELKLYLKKHLKNNLRAKFDFFIPDISWAPMTKDRELKEFILQRANKIVLLSDGNAQEFHDINERFKKNLATWNDSIVPLANAQSWENYLGNLKLKDKHTFFASNTLNKNIRLYTISEILPEDEDPYLRNFPLNYLDIAAQFPDIETEIKKNYQKIVKFQNNDFPNYIVFGKNFYDPTKKNVIWLGSSLFRHYDPLLRKQLRFSKQPYALAELRKVLAAFMKKYPPSQYNYFFKLHPYYQNDEAQNYVATITNNFKEAIILDAGISFENIVASEAARAKKEGSSYLFDLSEMKMKNHFSPKTLFIGGQPSSTVVKTTAILLSSIFDITYNHAYQFVNPENFIIPSSYDTVKRDLHYSSEQAQKINNERLEKIYGFDIEKGIFPKLLHFPSAQTFINKYLEASKSN